MTQPKVLVSFLHPTGAAADVQRDDEACFRVCRWALSNNNGEGKGKDSDCNQALGSCLASRLSWHSELARREIDHENWLV